MTLLPRQALTQLTKLLQTGPPLGHEAKTEVLMHYVIIRTHVESSFAMLNHSRLTMQRSSLDVVQSTTTQTSKWGLDELKL